MLSGQTYGSLSNLILSLTAVVWSSSAGQYVLKTFQRPNPDIRAFLAHLGRAFITSVTLQLAASPEPALPELGGHLRRRTCSPRRPAPGPTRSRATRTSAGRVEAIWFPFTDTPWLKVWSISPAKPALSVQVTSPYNYSFTNSVTTAENTFFDEVAAGDVSGTPAFEGTAMALVDTGLVFTGTWDIWGQWQNVLLYVKPTTVRIVEAGFAIITSRASIQQVVSDFYTQYTSRLSYYAGLGEYPMNGPVEIRVTGLDQHLGRPGQRRAVADPVLGTAAARTTPGWDTAVWLDMGTLPVTAGLLPVLRGHGIVDLEPLHRQLRDGPAGMVEGLGVHVHRAVDQLRHPRQHHPRRGQRRPGQRRRLEHGRLDPDLLRPELGVQQPVPGHPVRLSQAHEPCPFGLTCI